MMNSKIENNFEFSRKDLLMISLLCFMKSENTVERNILDSTVTIINIPNLDHEVSQFTKGIVLMLCDKFVKDESLKTTIVNLMGGNMKIVEDYAQRKVDESKIEIINKMHNDGISQETIVYYLDVSLDFVKKALSK